MDKCTHEVRKQYWKEIISQCMQRPQGMSAKQWLDNNGICEQTYYTWLKRIRQETYEIATASNTLPAKAETEVTFAEVSFPARETRASQMPDFQPDLTISAGSVVFGISNTASDALLNKVFEVIGYAR